jgi:hypothetical protein
VSWHFIFCEVEIMGGRQKTTLLNPVNKEEKKKQAQQSKE